MTNIDKLMLAENDYAYKVGEMNILEIQLHQEKVISFIFLKKMVTLTIREGDPLMIT